MTTIGSTKEASAAAKTRMEKAVEDFRKEIATLRTGRLLLPTVRRAFLNAFLTKLRALLAGPMQMA